MTVERQVPSRFPWPPLIYVAAIAAGIALSKLVPLPWITEPMAGILYAVGWLLAAGTVAIYIAVSRTLDKAKTSIISRQPPQHLITTGPFSFTRNPIFLADAMLLIGIGLISGIVWFLPLAIIAGFLTQKISIEHEERYFEQHFGKKYRDYAKRVRRWI